MGQAFDRSGNVLGEVSGETKREVFDRLTEAHPDAAEIRIKTAEAQESLARGAQEYNPPRIAPQRVNLDNVESVFTYQPWRPDQTVRGRAVTAALIDAAKTILRNVPECPTRTRAINNLIDARMLANAAITHDGRY